MVTALLVVIGVLTAVAVWLMIASFRRRDDLQGLTAMTLMIVAAIPSTLYGSMSS